MKLTELSPQFLRRDSDVSFLFVDTIAEATGIQFLCPKCFKENGGPVGTHAIICWNPSVPQTTNPVPGRWEMKGTTFGDLSLVAGSSSILLTSGCKWHGFVTNGEVTEA